MTDIVDYDAGGLRFGGYLEDIPKPHIRKWPGCPEKRKIKIRVMRYYSIGHHYHVSFEEEHNPIWDSKHNYWTIAWDDKDGKGKRDIDFYMEEDFPQTFRIRVVAVSKVKELVAKHFTDHEIEWDDYTDNDYEFYYAGKSE